MKQNQSLNAFSNCIFPKLNCRIFKLRLPEVTVTVCQLTFINRFLEEFPNQRLSLNVR